MPPRSGPKPVAQLTHEHFVQLLQTVASDPDAAYRKLVGEPLPFQEYDYPAGPDQQPEPLLPHKPAAASRYPIPVKPHRVYFTPTEVAAMLSVDRRTVYNWITTKQLYASRAGKLWQVSQEHLDTFLRSSGRVSSVPTSDQDQVNTPQKSPAKQPQKQKGRRR